MEKTKKELLDLKDEIDEAKTKVSELTGQKRILLSQLKKDWNCKTIEEAEVLLEQIGKSITQLEKKIEEGVQELEELLNPTEEEEE